jgi:hypothetical protein
MDPQEQELKNYEAEFGWSNGKACGRVHTEPENGS